MNWDSIYFDNTVQAWTTSIGLVLVIMIVVRAALGIVIGRIKKLAALTATDLDDLAVELLDKTRSLFIFLIAVWLGARPLTLPDGVETTIRGVLMVGLLMQGGFWGNGVIAYVSNKYKKGQADDPGILMAVGAVSVIARIALWSVLLLTVLGSMGVNVMAFTASLGIGGLAVALALQEVLGDLLGSLSIVFDKPFVIGDFVTVGDMSGTVEHVGLKTTRVRSISGEQLVFSNSDLLSSRIRNYGRMSERRVLFSLGAIYGTSPELLRQIPELVKSEIEKLDKTRFDRCHFKTFGVSSLDFEAVYFMQVPDYAAYMETQQSINLGIYDRFSEAGIEFAFPTQTLHLEPVTVKGRLQDEGSKEGADA